MLSPERGKHRWVRGKGVTTQIRTQSARGPEGGRRGGRRGESEAGRRGLMKSPMLDLQCPMLLLMCMRV